MRYKVSTMLVSELHPSQLLGGEGTRRQLATCLLVGGFNGEYEQAVAVSNDEDFAGSKHLWDSCLFLTHR